MGLSYVTKHLLDVSVSTLVIPVNCRGVAGRSGSLFDFFRYYYGLDARTFWLRLLTGQAI